MGSQQSYSDNTKLFQPIIDSNKKETTQLSNNFNNALLPMTYELKRTTDDKIMQYIRQALENASGLTNVFESTPRSHRSEGQVYHEATPPAATKGKEEEEEENDGSSSSDNIVYVNLDRDLNDTDRKNLASLGLPLPSNVDSVDEIKKAVVSNRRRLAQEFRTDRISRKSLEEIKVFESQKETLLRYEDILERLGGARKFIGKAIANQSKKPPKVRQKHSRRGRPLCRQTILYKNADDLVSKLAEYLASYNSGNNGVHNTIISILDELLQTKVICKNTFDSIIKNNNLSVA